MRTNSSLGFMALLVLAAGLLSGCNFFQLLAFRAQMRDIERYAAWEQRTGDWVFVFKSPLLTVRDLNGVGFFPERLDDQRAILRYRRQGGSTDEDGEYDIHLYFTSHRLSGVGFPRPLRDGFGPDNIKRLFVLLSGNSGPEAKLQPVTKSQAMAAGLLPGMAAPPGRAAKVSLEPIDRRNQVIELEMFETNAADRYSKFRFSVIQRPVKATPSSS